jgi:hypothetical protein
MPACTSPPSLYARRRRPIRGNAGRQPAAAALSPDGQAGSRCDLAHTIVVGTAIFAPCNRRNGRRAGLAGVAGGAVSALPVPRASTLLCALLANIPCVHARYHGMRAGAASPASRSWTPPGSCPRWVRAGRGTGVRWTASHPGAPLTKPNPTVSTAQRGQQRPHEPVSTVAAGRNAAAEFEAERIPGSARFDLDGVADHATTQLPHMLPTEEVRPVYALCHALCMPCVCPVCPALCALPCVPCPWWCWCGHMVTSQGAPPGLLARLSGALGSGAGWWGAGTVVGRRHRQGGVRAV